MAEEQARQTKQVGKAEKITGASRPVCFVIMPISDAPGYESGHFSRVYEYLLKPSIEAAGFEAVRADDEAKTDYIVTGIIKRIVESDMLLCDISTKNPNVLYELGIRHAFGKPVAIIKDKDTGKIFDIQGLRYYEYNESLRIDTVENDIVKIAETIQKTHASKDDGFNSAVSLAMMQSADVPQKKEISRDIQFVLNAIHGLESKISQQGGQSSSNISSKQNMTKTVGLNNEMFSVGDQIYDPHGNELGKITFIGLQDKYLEIKDKVGNIKIISFADVIKENISIYPF